MFHGVTFAVWHAIGTDGVKAGRVNGRAVSIDATAGAGYSLMFHHLYYTDPIALDTWYLYRFF